MRRWAWVLVAAVTCAVWAPTVWYGWCLTWDDGDLFILNPMIRGWSWTWMVTNTHWGHWMPLTWLSATLSYALSGLNPAPWHAVNVSLHTLSAVLFFCIARRLVGSDTGAVVAALLFAIHPLRMESVAWVAERKDVLMGVCFLSATLLWLQGRRWWAFLAFVAACLSKSPAVVLPVMLLALEWLRHRVCCRRLPRGLAWALAPFVAGSAVFSVIAFVSLAQVRASLPWSEVGLGPRLLHVAYSEVFYARQTVWPTRLSGLIEYTWLPAWDRPQYPLAVAVIALVATCLLLTWRRWPALTAAAVVYAVAVFPQAGLFQNGPQLVANRYSYLACLPLALLAGGAVTWGMRRWPVVSVSLSAAVVAALAITTTLALPMWRDGDAMWQYAALHEPTCTQCQDMAAGDDVRRGHLAQAIWHQERAIAVSNTTRYPRWERHWNLAALLIQSGKPDDAKRELRLYLAAVPPALQDSARHGGHYARARLALDHLEAGQL